MQKIGFIALLIGGCGMDSNSIVPAIMVIAGLTIIFMSVKKEQKNRP